MQSTALHFLHSHPIGLNDYQLMMIQTAVGESGGGESIGIYLLGTPAPEDSSAAFTINTYDGFNRLTQTLNEKGTANYAYKPDGLRLSKEVNGEKTTHLWNGSNIVADMDSDGTLIDTYVRCISLISSANNGYYLFNAHGDVTQLANSTGTITKNYHYDAFGVEVAPDTADANPFRYCGEYFDMETGSIYLRARYYNPAIGRFMAEDPIKDGLNWYTYCLGNPIRLLDPSGLTYIVQEMVFRQNNDIYYEKAGGLAATGYYQLIPQKRYNTMVNDVGHIVPKVGDSMVFMVESEFMRVVGGLSMISSSNEFLGSLISEAISEFDPIYSAFSDADMINGFVPQKKRNMMLESLDEMMFYLFEATGIKTRSDSIEYLTRLQFHAYSFLFKSMYNGGAYYPNGGIIPMIRDMQWVNMGSRYTDGYMENYLKRLQGLGYSAQEISKLYAEESARISGASDRLTGAASDFKEYMNGYGFY